MCLYTGTLLLYSVFKHMHTHACAHMHAQAQASACTHMMGSRVRNITSIIIHAMSHHHASYVTSSYLPSRVRNITSIIIHAMSHHHASYVTSSYLPRRCILDCTHIHACKHTLNILLHTYTCMQTHPKHSFSGKSYIYMHANTYRYIHAHACKHSLYIYMHANTYTYIHAHACKHSLYIYMHANTYMHMHANTY
jgi:hypothetical protein